MKTPYETKVGGIVPASRRSTPSVPALIEYKKMRFMIMDRPTNANLTNYIEVLFKLLVEPGFLIVKVCEFRNEINFDMHSLCPHRN